MATLEDLPQITRRLLLAKLDLEIVSENCANIYDLARKRNQPVNDIWRDICRNSGQARCPMPAQIGFAATIFPERAAPPANGNITPPSAAAREVVAVAIAAPARTSLTTARSTNAAPTAASPKAAAPARAGQAARRRPVMLAVGLSVLLASGIGLYLVVFASGPTATRVTEAVRVDRAQPDQQTGGSAGSQVLDGRAHVGTVRRLDAISKSFSKK